MVSGSVAQGLAEVPDGLRKALSVEHPSGEMTVIAHLGTSGAVARSEVLRTARKLMDGVTYP
jgi:4-oxalomesaconate tautomerase